MTTDRRAIGLALVALVILRSAAGYGDSADVPDDAIVLKVDETRIIAFTRSGDSLVNPRVLAAPTGSEPVVVFQLVDSGQARTLLVSNGYANTLRFRAVARMRARKRYFELPLSALEPGSRRSWMISDPFYELALFDFKLSD